jgi:hypothetical protein
MTNIISQVIALIVLIGLIIFWVAGWAIYGDPLGAVPLASCDIFGMDSLAVCK